LRKADVHLRLKVVKYWPKKKMGFWRCWFWVWFIFVGDR